jgi:hypothetical protein
MSMGPLETPPDGTRRPSKPGMSTGTKILLILGIAFLLLNVLCCGSLFAFDWFWRYFFRVLEIFP